MLDHAETDVCQARVFRRMLSEPPSFQNLPGKLEHRAQGAWNNRLSKNYRALGANLHPTGDRAKATPDRHETGVTLHATSVYEKKMNQ